MSSDECDDDKPINKPGRWTNEQIKFMQENHQSMSIEDMARQLEKNPVTVRKYIIEKLGYTEEAKLAITAKFDIKKSPIWDELKKQLSEEELDTFMYHWQNFLVQFKNDALSTERMQMVEVIRIEILINRAMRKLRETDVLLKQTQDDIMDEKSQPKDQQDQVKIARLEMLISSFYSAHQQLSKEYDILGSKKEGLLKTLRATREQRIKRIEDSHETIQTWMSALIDSPELRKTLGITAKKQQLSLYKELERLSDYHTYLTGEVERPITSCETVGQDDNL